MDLTQQMQTILSEQTTESRLLLQLHCLLPQQRTLGFHTITIEWTASGNVVVTFDNIVTTVSTDLPGTTTNLYFNAVAQTTTTTAKTLSLKGIWIETEG